MPPKPIRKKKKTTPPIQRPLTAEQEALVYEVLDRLTPHLEEAVRHGNLMIALWYRNGTDLKTWRKTVDFQTGDFTQALDDLAKNLDVERGRLE